MVYYYFSIAKWDVLFFPRPLNQKVISCAFLSWNRNECRWGTLTHNNLDANREAFG